MNVRQVIQKSSNAEAARVDTAARIVRFCIRSGRKASGTGPFLKRLRSRTAGLPEGWMVCCAVARASKWSAQSACGEVHRVSRIHRVCGFAWSALLAGAALSANPTLVGKPAPDFVLKSMDGRNLRLSEFRGQVVLVNFWAR